MSIDVYNYSIVIIGHVPTSMQVCLETYTGQLAYAESREEHTLVCAQIDCIIGASLSSPKNSCYSKNHYSYVCVHVCLQYMVYVFCTCVT